VPISRSENGPVESNKKMLFTAGPICVAVCELLQRSIMDGLFILEDFFIKSIVFTWHCFNRESAFKYIFQWFSNTCPLADKQNARKLRKLPGAFFCRFLGKQINYPPLHWLERRRWQAYIAEYP